MQTTDSGVEFTTSGGAKVQVTGWASKGHKPYLRIEASDGDYLGTLDLADLRKLRDAITEAVSV